MRPYPKFRVLFEGLLALAIVSIVASILFPVFADGSPPAPWMAALSNVKQLATGTQIYLADHDDAWPVGPAPAGRTALGWAGRIQPYGLSAPLFTVREELSEAEAEDRREGHVVSFGMNANLATAPNANRVGELERAILLFEVDGARSTLDKADANLQNRRLSPVGDGTRSGLRDSLSANASPRCRYALGLDEAPWDRGARRSTRDGEPRTILAFADGHARAVAPSELRTARWAWTFQSRRSR